MGYWALRLRVDEKEYLEKLVFGKKGALTSGTIEKKDVIPLVPGGTGIPATALTTATAATATAAEASLRVLACRSQDSALITKWRSPLTGPTSSDALGCPYMSYVCRLRFHFLPRCLVATLSLISVFPIQRLSVASMHRMLLSSRPSDGREALTLDASHAVAW